jgi:hypothetical protein
MKPVAHKSTNRGGMRCVATDMGWDRIGEEEGDASL